MPRVLVLENNPRFNTEKLTALGEIVYIIDDEGVNALDIHAATSKIADRLSTLNYDPDKGDMIGVVGPQLLILALGLALAGQHPGIAHNMVVFDSRGAGSYVQRRVDLPALWE